MPESDAGECGQCYPVVPGVQVDFLPTSFVSVCQRLAVRPAIVGLLSASINSSEHRTVATSIS